MLVIWKSFLHRRADRHHRHDIGQVHVAHYRATHHARPLIVTMDERSDEERHAREPRYRVELFPEAADDQRDIEAKNERDWNEIVERVTVLCHQLEPSVLQNDVRYLSTFLFSICTLVTYNSLAKLNMTANISFGTSGLRKNAILTDICLDFS